MPLTRRRMLQGTAALAFAALDRTAFAEDQPAVPIVFVHGDSDLAATWETQIWRFESNGYPRDRLFAISFTDPQARDDDTVPQANRSSTQDQIRELTGFIDGVKAQTGAPKVALVARSRGGYATREYVAANPASVVSAALGGTPNHGVFAIDAMLGSEYNGHGPFLQKLDAGDSEVTTGVPFLTLRSDGFDLYAQPDGAIVFGKPGMPLNVTADGPALKGANNVLLGEVDHRETALSPVAFAQIYKFITGREPERIAIAPEAAVVLNGRVTGVVDGTPTNRPVEGAKVEVHRVSAETGERQGAAALTKTTGADGVWGPVTVDPATPLEFVVAASGAPITHIYRSPLPRSFDKLDLRSAAPAKDDAGAAAVVRMDRPRGYFGLPRDIVLLDGKEPADVPHGVPDVWHTYLRLPAFEDRPIIGEFNEERIVARPWPAKDGHYTMLELTG
ncbi:MAG: hydrolase [Hyphomicrobiales bacterium]|nr:hydrolase [Hyphomicrobiales bacterium]